MLPSLLFRFLQSLAWPPWRFPLLAWPPTPAVPGLVAMPKSQSWQHSGSGFELPKNVAGFERETVSPLPALDGASISYRLTTHLPGGLDGYTNETVSIMSAKDKSLKEIFAARQDALVRYGSPGGAKLVKTGETAVGKVGGIGLYARYTTTSRNFAGYNEDGHAEVVVYKYGNYVIEFVASFADNRSDLGFKAISSFKQKFGFVP